MRKSLPVVLALTIGMGLGMPSTEALTPQARDYYNQAVQAERRGNLEEAEQALRKAIGLDPQDYLNVVKLASILNQQGKPNEAISYYQKALTLNPQDVMILYSLGGIYEQMGQYDKAEEAYGLTLQNNPRYQFGLLNLARTEIQQKKYDPAIGHYQQFLQRYPEHYEARRHLAKLYLATGREGESVREYDLLKQRFPQQFGDHLDLARALTGSDQPRLALEELKTAYAKEGGKSDISEEMGRAHAALGQFDQAIRNYQKAYSLNNQKEDLLIRIADLYRGQKDYGMAIENYKAYLAKHPDDQDVRRMLAGTYLDDKRFEPAANELSAMLQSTTDPQKRFDLQKDMAFAVQMAGELPQAVSLYEDLLHGNQTARMADKDLQLKSNLAIALHKMHAYDRAVAVYKQIYYADAAQQQAYHINRDSLGNDLAIALTAVGDAAFKAGDYNMAVSNYGDAVLYAAKTNAWPHLGLGNAYYALKMPDKAYEAYGATLDREPGNVTAKLYRTKLAMEHPESLRLSEKETSALGQTHLGVLEKLARENPDNQDVQVTLADAYATQGNATGAIALYEKALALQPDNPEQMNLLLAIGTQWQKLGNFEQARNIYLRALAINNQLPELHYNLGIVYNELGQLEQSAKSYQQAMMLDPDNADSRYGLAITLEKQQKYQDALEAYENYTTAPNARYTKEARERIELLKQALNPARQPAIPSGQPPVRGANPLGGSDGAMNHTDTYKTAPLPSHAPQAPSRIEPMTNAPAQSNLSGDPLR
jgi:tetratricopeptide (TPR) repeat protein